MAEKRRIRVDEAQNVGSMLAIDQVEAEADAHRASRR